MTDIVFLSLLVLALGGVEGGVGILLVFTSAVAAVLLPSADRAVPGVHGQPGDDRGALWLPDPQISKADALLRAGLYGITAMVSAVMTHQLAYWARDYRLIAEKHRATLSELEQVNELIIRRMRTGVIAVDHDDRIRVMNESAWFLMGSPPVRQRYLKTLSPRLDQALTEWKEGSICRSETGFAGTQPGTSAAEFRGTARRS